MAYETTTSPGTRGTRPPGRRGSGGIWMALIGAAVVLAGIWLIWAWWDTDDGVVEDEYGVVGEPAPGEREGITQSEAAPSIEEIGQRPAHYEGQSVTVTGQVEERLGLNALRVQGHDGDVAILVLDNRGRPIDIEPNEDIRVTGNVQVFSMSQVQDQLGMNLDPDIFRDYEGRPALMATSIQAGAQAREGAPGSAAERTP